MSDYNVLIIPVDSKPYTAVWDLPGPENTRKLLDALQAHIEPIVGGNMEHVNVFWRFGPEGENRYLDMFVNDVGKVEGLPVNIIATVVYHNNLRVHQPELHEHYGDDYIAGPAVLFERKVWV
jgi:hypothetical protein